MGYAFGMKDKTNREDRFTTPPTAADEIKAPKDESMEDKAKRLGFKYSKKA